MKVTLDVHLELVNKATVWWAETDLIPGFSAAADSARELQERARAAVIEILSDQGTPPESVAFRLVVDRATAPLAETDPDSSGVSIRSRTLTAV